MSEKQLLAFGIFLALIGFVLSFICLIPPANAQPVDILPIEYALESPQEPVQRVEEPPRYQPPTTPLERLKTPVWDKRLDGMEVTWQVLHFVDILQTMDCAHKNTKHQKLRCVEVGSAKHFIGRNPKESEIVAWGIGNGLAHYFLGKLAKDAHPIVGLIFQSSTIGLKAETVAANFDIKF